MCQSWEFGCGHITQALCPSFKTRELFEPVKGKGKERATHNDDNDDPFVDTRSRSDTPKNRVTPSHSNPHLIPPPAFNLPSPTLSSVVSEKSVTSPAHHARQSSSDDHDSGPGPAVYHYGPVVTPQLPAHPDLLRIMEACKGPAHNRNKTNIDCYECILRRNQSDTTCQQNEREAATRLYEEINHQTASIQVDRLRTHKPAALEEEEEEEDDEQTQRPSARITANRNHAVDLGRGNPPPAAPQGPASHRSATGTVIRGGGRARGGGSHLHQHQYQLQHPLPNRPPAQSAARYPQPRQRQQASQYLDLATYHGPAPPQMMMPTSQFAQYPPNMGFHYQINPYGGVAVTEGPFHGYQAHPAMQMQMQMQMQMEMEMQYQGEHQISGRGVSGGEGYAYPPFQYGSGPAPTAYGYYPAHM